MPKIKTDRIGIALDMYGCPNRCRHCCLGFHRGRRMLEEDLQWAAEQFRGYIEGRLTGSPIKALAVSSWFRERDSSDNYRRLYELEAKLSDCKPYRYELLSIWRLARDEEYATWAQEIGTEVCQISFFGLEDTNDWFHRRRGAFQDAITATKRLLEAGIRPRWQLFLTKKIFPDIGGLLKLVEKMKLRERTPSLGGEFDLFMHTPGPDGEARNIEYLRPTINETKSIPEEIIESSRKHFGRERLWQPEAELVSQILNDEDVFPYAYSYPQVLWFLIKSNWDVFPNMGTMEEWWKLGNLKQDSVSSILVNFEKNSTVGLKAIFEVSPKELAKQYGDGHGSKVYSSKQDLLSLFVGNYCEEVWRE